MKRFGIVLFALFSFSSLFGQANKDWDGVKPEVYPGSKSVVFTYTPFQSDLGGVPTGSIILPSGFDFLRVDLVGVGFKIFVSSKISLLASLGYGLNSATQEPNAPSTLKTEVTTAYWSGAIAANFHFASFYSIAPYVGISIHLSALAADATMSDPPSDSKVEFSSTSFGTGAHFGFDWFFTEGISLGGQYSLRLNISPESEITTTSSSGTATTEKGPSLTTFGTGVGTIILNVHF